MMQQRIGCLLVCSALLAGCAGGSNGGGSGTGTAGAGAGGEGAVDSGAGSTDGDVGTDTGDTTQGGDGTNDGGASTDGGTDGATDSDATDTGSTDSSGDASTDAGDTSTDSGTGEATDSGGTDSSTDSGDATADGGGTSTDSGTDSSTDGDGASTGDTTGGGDATTDGGGTSTDGGTGGTTDTTDTSGGSGGTGSDGGDAGDEIIVVDLGADLATIEANFDRIQTDFFAGDVFSVSSFPDAGSGPDAGSLSFDGQLSLFMGTLTPLVSAQVKGDAELVFALSNYQMTGAATGFIGQIRDTDGNPVLAAYPGTIQLSGGLNAQSLGQYDEILIVLSGDLTEGGTTFEVGGTLEGYFRGTDGSVFRGTANFVGSEAADAPGNMDVKILSNPADYANAVLYLERTPTSP